MADRVVLSPCRLCGAYAERCHCPVDLLPYARGTLHNAATTCSSPRIRADLELALRILNEHVITYMEDNRENPVEP